MSGAALEGELQHFRTVEILQLLQLAMATGRLELARAGTRVEVAFVGGRPVGARSDGPAVRTGEVLVRRCGVPAAAVAAALAAQAQAPGERLGARLVAAGAATAEQVADAVTEVWKRILFGAILWREGRFRFVPGEPGESPDIALGIELDRLILEGLRIADETAA